MHGKNHIKFVAFSPYITLLTLRDGKHKIQERYLLV